MALVPRSVVTLMLSASWVIFASGQQPNQSTAPAAPATDPTDPYVASATPGEPFRIVRQPPAPAVTGGSWFFHRFGIGTYTSPLGFGGRIATSLTESLNLRVGGNFFSYTTKRTADNIPFTAHVLLQSEQATFDWYPFRGRFHVSPGVLFGNSNRAYGSAMVPAGISFTLNGVTYYSGAANPVQASGYVEFERVTPTLTLGSGNWIRHSNVRGEQGHWTFPFEAGVSFNGDPKTALNYSGIVCNAGQTFCRNIATDPTVQANIQAERRRLQNDANWVRYYPLISGGIVYRF
jgi:hypothetical protein